MEYNWQRKNWPQFSYDTNDVHDILMEISVRLGRLNGILEALPSQESVETAIDSLTIEALQTSAIEGEYLNREDVASSIRKNLGLKAPRTNIADKRAEGIAALMTLVRSDWRQPLSAALLNKWHKALMYGDKYVTQGAWRAGKEAMQLLSGSIGKEVLHFEAPPSARVDDEMDRFISWYNATSSAGSKPIRSGPVRAAIAHYYFETIHPYEDGNGRIGRAIVEKAMYEWMGFSGILSISSTIAQQRSAYYAALQSAQRSLDLTAWVVYFVHTIETSLVHSEELIHFTLAKTKLYDRLKGALNNRQQKVLDKMLSNGAQPFEGGMTAKKYTRLTKTSKPTATRDLQSMVELGVLLQEGGGRSVKYQVKLGM